MIQKNNCSILQRFPSAKVAVLGDLMLDVYLWGSVSRISPEAPVPVINIRKRTCCLGGAANVMRNITSLRAQAWAYGVLGNDQSGTEMVQELEKSGINSPGVLLDNARKTTEKRRIISGSQQLLREDFEDIFPVDDSLRHQLVSAICNQIEQNKINAVIFDDYAKGVLADWMLEEIIQVANKKNIVTVLDPKPRRNGINPVKGLTLLKPNRAEAFALAGITDPGFAPTPKEDKTLHHVADILMHLWQPEILLISLAAQGMALYENNGKVSIIPTQSREVFDVSGAGDTVAAVAALALATGANPIQAAMVANLAAGVVVGKIGTVPITFEELNNAILTHEG